MTPKLEFIALPGPRPAGRVTRDRLEILQALIDAPTFDPRYRDDIIEIPPDDAVYQWACSVEHCLRVLSQSSGDYCQLHQKEWAELVEQTGGAVRKSDFVKTAQNLPTATDYLESEPCRICPDRPSFVGTRQLCFQHNSRWKQLLQREPDTDFDDWIAGQAAYIGYGECRTLVCRQLAWSALGLCHQHEDRYDKAGRPGGACLPAFPIRRFERQGKPIPIIVEDEAAFRRWCVTAQPVLITSQVNLRGLRPLAAAEIRWGLDEHAKDRDHTKWHLNRVRAVAELCRLNGYGSLADVDLTACRKDLRMVVAEILIRLRPLYFTRADSRELGFVETEHFGRRFKGSAGYFNLTDIPQRWLRDIVWDHFAGLLDSADCPRSRRPFDGLRRGALEVSAFLTLRAPEAGHGPGLLTREHALAFAADHRHRAASGLPSLGCVGPNGTQSFVSPVTAQVTFNAARKLLYQALESGHSDEIGLDREFITALPSGGANFRSKRRFPFDDDAAKALSNRANLEYFAERWDPNDKGLRDIWETIVATGRRCSEVLELRLECIGRYGKIPKLQHDQTKVGQFDKAIRIPEAIYLRLDARRALTIRRFEHRHGRLPTPEERQVMALFPTHVRNPRETKNLSYGHFNSSFREWVNELDLGRLVPHQARHTLATNLLKAGASLTHIRKYLGQVSDRMAEHYIEIASTELDDVLARVWVSGPGAENPGEPLFSTVEPLGREEAQAMAVEVGRRCTPTLGGLCTAQVVVDGGKCPRNLDCESCDQLVLTGADLLYWRRKREHWYSIAERAPDEATAEWLHKAFDPTARAIDGLEKALAGLGLLEQALALDMRRPQDYFGQIWSTGFAVPDLVGPTEGFELEWDEEDEA